MIIVTSEGLKLRNFFIFKHLISFYKQLEFHAKINVSNICLSMDKVLQPQWSGHKFPSQGFSG